MYLDKLSISGYKSFGEKFEIQLNKGLNVLVGENGVGKSAIIDAIRLIMNEDEYGRYGLSENDFHCPFTENGIPSGKIEIIANFTDLSESDSVTFLPWTDGTGNAKITYIAENKENNRGKYIIRRWGGESPDNIFERECLDLINCIYLPPLRDAEAKLREGRGSRLARLLINLNKDELEKAKRNGTHLPLEREVEEFYGTLESDKDKTISKANSKIQESLKEVIGESFGQGTKIRFSETNFYRIVENLRLYFYPQITDEENINFRNLKENSLGYNNLLYIATVLAELTITEDPEVPKILLIEEPEAHLHPQLQTKLLKYLDEISVNSNIQIIVTTHSPVLASAVSLDSIVHLCINSENNIISTPICDCGLPNHTLLFIKRWLDVTKSTLLFARGIILVEGIAEAMVVPVLAKRVIKEYNDMKGTEIPATLEEQGISVINMNGIHFIHFMQLFCNLDPNDTNSISIPIMCAGITDKDPDKEAKPIPETRKCPENESKNPAWKLVETVKASKYCRLMSNLKTFEYDLALEGGNLNPMIDTFLDILSTDGDIRDEWVTKSEEDWSNKRDEDKAETCYQLLKRIDSNVCGKGIFSQNLAEKLDNPSIDFMVPEYIKEAIIWVCAGE